jgi:hypothetical protein
MPVLPDKRGSSWDLSLGTATMKEKGATMENTKATNNNPTPLTAPKGTDPQWQEKVATARQARETAKAMRAGKPISFRKAVGRAG